MFWLPAYGKKLSPLILETTYYFSAIKGFSNLPKSLMMGRSHENVFKCRFQTFFQRLDMIRYSLGCWQRHLIKLWHLWIINLSLGVRLLDHHNDEKLSCFLQFIVQVGEKSLHTVVLVEQFSHFPQSSRRRTLGKIRVLEATQEFIGVRLLCTVEFPCLIF